MTDPERVIVKTYKGTETAALAKFQSDSKVMAAQGFFPTSQSWAPGSYGCGAFLIALLLCLILIGFIVFIYMLIVKPEGTLSVTYEFRGARLEPWEFPEEDKTCPRCAERVKGAALVCRYCGYEFSQPVDVNDG